MVASTGSGAAIVTKGHQLAVGGTSEQVTAVNALVGPNALLGSGSYPAPASASHGPLTDATPTFTGGFWRINSTPGSGQNNLVSLWTSPTAAYSFSNSPSNLGGIVQADTTIDGYPVPGGTYVYQFMDLSAGGVGNFLLQSGGQPVLFRGCRLRAAASSPGFFNSQSGGYNKFFAMHYCDLGGAGISSECDIAVQVSQSGGTRLLRNYISWIGSAVQPAATNVACDVIENFAERFTLFNGSLHLNGLKFSNGDTNCRWLRNLFYFDSVDALGNQITQTDVFGMIPTFGEYDGTGINPDGTAGYQIKDNTAAGAGYCYYLGSNSLNSPVSNLVFTGNEISTGQFRTGGANGPYTFAPPSGWDANGNVQSGNLWVDGPNAGQSFI